MAGHAGIKGGRIKGLATKVSRANKGEPFLLGTNMLSAEWLCGTRTCVCDSSPACDRIGWGIVNDCWGGEEDMPLINFQ